MDKRVSKIVQLKMSFEGKSHVQTASKGIVWIVVFDM